MSSACTSKSSSTQLEMLTVWQEKKSLSVQAENN